MEGAHVSKRVSERSDVTSRLVRQQHMSDQPRHASHKLTSCRTTVGRTCCDKNNL